jgi:hypothetical protein
MEAVAVGVGSSDLESIMPSPRNRRHRPPDGFKWWHLLVSFIFVVLCCSMHLYSIAEIPQKRYGICFPPALIIEFEWTKSIA